jgi:hypothetical protein
MIPQIIKKRNNNHILYQYSILNTEGCSKRQFLFLYILLYYDIYFIFIYIQNILI